MNINVKIMNVVKQKNTYDCGVYALAYATSILLKIDPCTVEFVESKLRRHLIKCLENKRFTAFPSNPRNSRNYRKKIIQKTVSFKIHCICKKPECGLLFQCDGCDLWFHPECVGLTRQFVNEHEEAFCNNAICIAKG